MNYRWFTITTEVNAVTGEPVTTQQRFVTKHDAGEFAADWARENPSGSTVVYRQKDRQATLEYSFSDGHLCKRNLSAKPAASRRNARNWSEQVEVDIQNLGYTEDQARTIRRRFFDICKQALARGESVETPAGTISVQESPRERRRVRNYHGEWKLQRLFLQPKRVRFKPDENLYPSPPPIPLPPEPAPPPPPLSLQPRSIGIAWTRRGFK